MIDREKFGSLLRKHGRAYTGIKRPKGYRRQWTQKACYRNAALIANRGVATYVEGLGTKGTINFEHAWITLDGEHAIDPTWSDAQDCLYFGIAFPIKLVAQKISRDGYVSPLLNDPEIVAVLETAADAAEAQAALRMLDLLSPRGRRA